MDVILVVEDNSSLRKVLCQVLARDGFSVLDAESAEASHEILESHPVSCVLCDFKLPGADGIALLKMVREAHPHLPFVIMTAFGSVDIAVEAMKSGATDFISKPFEPRSLAPMLREVIQHNRILDRSSFTRKGLQHSIVTQSPKMERILAQAQQVARVDTSVLLLGESGTGKEVLARYIHEHSPRHDKPFIALNCGAIPAELLESEFFGHESGAFTGATQTRQGVLEVASEGTVFLDEVGEMPPSLQVKLLRALQEHEIRRVGGSATIKIAPRIVAATNRSMEEALESGAMREDFYFRLAVVTFALPPLRDRVEDIRPLMERFINHFRSMMGREDLEICPLALDILESYSWPGNIRELENVIERAVLLADTEIRPEHLGIQLHLDLKALEEATRTLPEIAARAVQHAEVEAIMRALKITNGNKTKAAQVLGVSYKTLLHKVKEYRLEQDPVGLASKEF
jgi:DNA-binding NtrC family response regulator